MHDPIALVDDSLRLVRQAIPGGVVISVRTDGAPPPILVDRTRFVQVLLNLATNAAAAMEGRGELTIAIGGLDRASKPGCLRLRVTDTGCGMDKTTLERAFEPFFTTKPVGEGTGLGLPLVYGLVKDMGGTVELDSELGRGTTVTISIPAAPNQAAI